MNYYNKTVEEVMNEMQTSSHGLDSSQVKERLKKYGLNILPKSTEKVTRLKIFFFQFSSPFIFILLI